MSYSLISGHLGRAPELGVLRDFVQIFSAREAATWLACLLAARIFCKHGKALCTLVPPSKSKTVQTLSLSLHVHATVHVLYNN